MSDFDCWAAYYDLIHQGLAGEAEFYVGQALRCGGKTLELGCGTGRIAIAMAMSGARVTGLDVSRGMLEICREKIKGVGVLKGEIEVVQQDMVEFDLGEGFEFIAMPYRTFMHLHRPEQQRGCLNSVHRHLKGQGLFILNTWHPDRSVVERKLSGDGEEEFSFVDEYGLPGTDERVKHYHRASFDYFQQRIIEEHLIEEVDGEGRVYHTTTLPLIRTWTTYREMDNLVRLCGFEVEAVFGDFDCAPLTASCTEMIWVLRKGG